jgi:hypothetical protein
LLAATASRLGLAGVLAGLAAATKQQALLYLPLVVALAALVPRPKSHGPRRSAWLRFALGFAMIAVAVICWDLARVQRPGFFAQSLISYGGLAAARPEVLAERAVAWLQLVGSFWTSPNLNGLLLAGLLAWWAGALLRWQSRWTWSDAVLAAFVIGFLLFHWLVGFQVWDRYLLGLVPLAALLAARALTSLSGAVRRPSWRSAWNAGLFLIALALLVSPALQATKGLLPLGGDHGAYDGIDDLADCMREQAAPGSVLYHAWLGYHHRFYLYGAPLRLHWYPDLDDLARDATIYRREPRYIAFPSWRDAAPAQAALARASIALSPVMETNRRDGSVSFRLYRLEGP